MGFWQDFKAFAVKGNVIDLAVGVIIGGAFGKIVSALVDDIIMPVAGLMTGEGRKFVDKFYILKPAKAGDIYQSLAEARAAGANILAYGEFIQRVVDFFIIAISIFISIRIIKKMKEKHEEKEKAAPPAPTTTEKLLMEIRDTLKKGNTDN